MTMLRDGERFAVDPDRIDELIDWALAQDWDVDEGERIREEAWRTPVFANVRADDVMDRPFDLVLVAIFAVAMCAAVVATVILVVKLV